MVTLLGDRPQRDGASTAWKCRVCGHTLIVRAGLYCPNCHLGRLPDPTKPAPVEDDEVATLTPEELRDILGDEE